MYTCLILYMCIRKRVCKYLHAFINVFIYFFKRIKYSEEKSLKAGGDGGGATLCQSVDF